MEPIRVPSCSPQFQSHTPVNILLKYICSIYKPFQAAQPLPPPHKHTSPAVHPLPALPLPQTAPCLCSAFLPSSTTSHAGHCWQVQTYCIQAVQGLDSASLSLFLSMPPSGMNVLHSMFMTLLGWHTTDLRRPDCIPGLHSCTYSDPSQPIIYPSIIQHVLRWLILFQGVLKMSFPSPCSTSLGNDVIVSHAKKGFFSIQTAERHLVCSSDPCPLK